MNIHGNEYALDKLAKVRWSATLVRIKEILAIVPNFRSFQRGLALWLGNYNGGRWGSPENRFTEHS